MKYLTKYRLLEFIVAGLAIDLLENMLTIKLTSDAPITWNTVLIALMVVVPFAVVTELVMDHPQFWHRCSRFCKRLVGMRK